MNSKEFIISLLEICGRGSISVLAAIGISKTQWYQNLNSLNLIQPDTLIISICIFFVCLWMFLPIIKYDWNSVFSGESE